MFDEILAKLRIASRRGGQPDRVSILLPFLIISIGLGVLAWRSYNLSMRAEAGAKTLARQYSAYAAEITGTRIDAAIRGEMALVADEWQQMERRLVGEPTFSELRDWITQHDWIVSAIYVPDYDPASSIYVSELTTKSNHDVRLTREFYTATGMIRYTYDPARLLTTRAVVGAFRQNPIGPAARGLGIDQAAKMALVRNQAEGVTSLDDGYAAVARFAPPLD